MRNMQIRGYQTWFTADRNMTCITITPFCIGMGTKCAGPATMAILDIVLLGFGLSMAWDITPNKKRGLQP